MVVEGYKAFNSDWTCRSKQYSCPGVFEQDGELKLCKNGIHFCKSIERCFYYYPIEGDIGHIAKVMAIGDVIEDEYSEKCCTNKLVIIEEIPFETIECLKNIGFHNDGFSNYGCENIGNYNFGDWNIGDGNYGILNRGSNNSGRCNIGSGNAGDFNIGNENIGNWNVGGGNSGNCNIGDCNTGDWNVGNKSNGFFNTQPQKIYMFNKPTNLTYEEVQRAYKVLGVLKLKLREWLMTRYNHPYLSRTELDQHPHYFCAALHDGGSFFSCVDMDKIKIEMNKMYHTWFSQKQKEQILALPNFDAEIFKETTGIDVNEA